MSRHTAELLEAFESLSEEEKRVFASEVMRRSLPWNSGPLGDDDIASASAGLYAMLDAEEANEDDAGAR